MASPTIYTPERLVEQLDGGPKVGLPDGRWVPARPESWGGLMFGTRIWTAWLVFTGRADVLRWTDQP